MTKFTFFSNLAAAPWGGSEELWSQTACLLAKRGISVSASVREKKPFHERVGELSACGVDVFCRPWQYPLWQKAWRKIVLRERSAEVIEFARLGPAQSTMIIFSNESAFPPLDLTEYCTANHIPFVSIAQNNHNDWWPGDEVLERYIRVLSAARRCYFVSKANWKMTETHLASRLSNAEVIRNPFNVRYDASPPWPDSQIWRLGCVARLSPDAKGQDLLLELLSTSKWRERPLHVTFYGTGPRAAVLQRLAKMYDLSVVEFAGHAGNIEEVWSRNHALILPSRYEGLPLAAVEAMLCSRIAIMTAVGGNPEIVEDGTTGYLAEAPTLSMLDDVMERAWRNRNEWRRMGLAAGRRIRELVPEDPVAEFADRLLNIAGVQRSKWGGNVDATNRREAINKVV